MKTVFHLFFSVALMSAGVLFGQTTFKVVADKPGCVYVHAGTARGGGAFCAVFRWRELCLAHSLSGAGGR